MQLALVGSMASDDPEGWDFYNSTLAHADGDPDIHILNNFNNVGAIEVNAFQSLADVVIQKSHARGLRPDRVSEALWKGRPFIGGDVGGIPLQVEDGESGYLVSTVEDCAKRSLEILNDPALGQGARAARQGARARALPHAALPARLSEDLPRGAVDARSRPAPLVLVSNRGPVTYQDDGSVKRGTGGLVTALTGLASHRDAVWIASAMTDGDVDGRSASTAASAFEVEAPDGGDVPRALRRVRRRGLRPLLQHLRQPDALVHPALPLGPEQRAGHPPRTRSRRSSTATTSSTRTWREAVLEEIEGQEEPVVMVHDYHLYTLPGMVRERAPGRLPAPLRPHPVDAAGRLARAAEATSATRSTDGLLANDIVGFHTRSYRRNFLQCCRDLHGPRGRHGARRRAHSTDREVWVRAYPLPIDYEATRAVAARDRVTRVRGEAAARAGASTRSCASTARTSPRTSCAGSPASTSSSSSTRSSPSGSRSPRS